MEDHRLVFLAGVILLCVCCIITYVFIRGSPRKSEPLFYVWSVFAFTACIDLILALDLDGYLRGFMSFYLEEGEPYLKTAHGTLINWWDGTGHYSMYLTLLSLCTTGRSYRDLGLYWAGSIGNSMLVLMTGSISGRFGIKWSYMLNIPYVVFPFWAAVRFLNEGRKPSRRQDSLTAVPSIWTRPLDLIFVLYLVFSTIVAFCRAMVVLGCGDAWAKTYLKDYEPYLMDNNNFPKMQMLVYFFYFAPFYVAAIYGLMYTEGQSWLSDWSLLHAGASAQAQISHIGSSFHDLTATELHVPPTHQARQIFWIINFGCLLIGPQLLAIRCYFFNGNSTGKLAHSTINENSPSVHKRKKYR
ncbi:hypothetical protein ScPMuIL_018529 [Solemya velum]